MIPLATSFAQSVLDPAGPQAAHISRLWWLLFWMATAVFVLVLGALAAALAARRPTSAIPAIPATEATEAAFTLNPGEAGERWRFRTVAAATGVTVVLLFGLLVASVATGREIASLDAPRALTLEVVGHQWWWEVHYLDPDPAGSFVTANEIHIPVGRPVLVRTLARDVIHSLWIPNLHGKRDLIPGHSSVIWIEADRPGLYRGQCAEFCGYQHAHMALDVFADPPGRFAAWVAAQRQSAPNPAGTLLARGAAVFQTSACPLCHTVQGTGANGQNAPDLTHVAGRRTLAAGALPNTPRGLWPAGFSIPQAPSPAPTCPPTSLDPDDLAGLSGLPGDLAMSAQTFDATLELERQPSKRTWAQPAGIVGWLTNVDHKTIGLRYIVTAFVFFLLGGIEALAHAPAAGAAGEPCSWARPLQPGLHRRTARR